MPTDYSELLNLFIHLRNRGISLSTIDLDILQSWEKNKLNIEFISKIMLEISVEAKSNNKNFPSTLEPISRKLNKILLKMREA